MTVSHPSADRRQAPPTPVFVTGGPPTTAEAIDDIRQSLQRWELWLTMAWQDIKQRYRGSMLGPFWVTINMGVMVALLAVIYGRLLNVPAKDYLPFVTLGFLSWRWMEHTISESSLLFVAARRYINQVRLPVTLFVFRLIARNLIVLAHNFAVYIIVLFVVGLRPGWAVLMAIPGLALVTICLFWISMLFAMLGARFRDFPQIVTSLIQVIFYVTPILWQPAQLGAKRYFFVDYNPVYYFIEIVREPLMGQLPPEGFWKATALMTLVLTLIVFPMFRRFRGRVAYWV
jgi:ABC-type polysaccharide/polyol phosphate export permease